VGFHYAHSLLHKIEMAVSAETDTPEVLNEILRACRKGGRVAIMGAFAAARRPPHARPGIPCRRRPLLLLCAAVAIGPPPRPLSPF
jgi:hypothetical protein